MARRNSALKIGIHVGIDLHALAGIEHDYATNNYLVYHVRAQYCTRYRDMYREVSAAFQLPWYFGENTSALQECLSEVGESGANIRGVVLSLWNCSQFFRAEEDRRRKVEGFESLLESVAVEMRDPSTIVVGESLQRREFVLLLHDQQSVPVREDESMYEVLASLGVEG